MRRASISLVTMLAPLLVAAADPAGDVGPCPHVPAGHAPGTAPDLVSATGEIVELGTSIRIVLRFDESLVVPDPNGRPFRIDVVLFDPDVPPVEAGLYRGLNRILRYDAVPDAVTTTLLLPEAGQSRFLPPTIDGDSFVLQVPGRTVVADEDETGTSPGLDRLRWGVIVRDEASCDLLGSGRPRQRLVPGVAAPTTPTGDGLAAVRPGRWWITTAAAAGLACLVAAAYLVRRRARSAR